MLFVAALRIGALWCECYLGPLLGSELLRVVGGEGCCQVPEVETEWSDGHWREEAAGCSSGLTQCVPCTNAALQQKSP